MRLVGVFAIACMGCAPPMSATEPATPTVSGISNDELDARLVGLRATLSRSGIALDDVAEVSSCRTAHLGSRCVSCDVARRDNTAGIEPSLIDSAAITFAMYPPALLAATKIENVALCRTIEVGESEMAPAGMALLDQHRILVNVGTFLDASDSFTIDRVIHHELFHMLDYAGAYYVTDSAWASLNPKGFAYVDPEKLYRERELSPDRPQGFVGSYATQNEAEDRASTFELVVSRPADACAIAAKDPIVAKKVALIKKRVNQTMGASVLFEPCKKPPAASKRRGPVDLKIQRP